jgi:hypothetical protein
MARPALYARARCACLQCSTEARAQWFCRVT